MPYTEITVAVWGKYSLLRYLDTVGHACSFAAGLHDSAHGFNVE